jgi:hypothetical protein
MECYMMTRTRAQALAEALRKKHRRRRKAIDAESVRMYCITNAEQEREPLDDDWLETGPIAELVAWVDIEKLLGTRH